VDGVQEFSHDGDIRLEHVFATRDEAGKEGVHVGVVSHRDGGRQEQRSAKVLVARSADVRRFVHRRAGVMLAWIETGMSDPLSWRQIAGQQRKLGDERKR
jgi:hypothetical protein